MRAQVEECIEIIRPALQADGGDIELKDVVVEERARLVGVDGGIVLSTLRFFSKQSLLVTARALGTARAAFELAREYCDTRREWPDGLRPRRGGPAPRQ